MLTMADTDLNLFLPTFSELGIDVTFLVPTPNGYKKSIMDATVPVRNFLYSNNIHNYNTQIQGQDYKTIIPTFFVCSDCTINSSASLYRPITKNGDPRIWFYKLKQYCNPCNLLAITTNNNALYVVNLSDPNISNSLLSRGYVYRLLLNISNAQQKIANELLYKIQQIHNMGFIKTIRNGDSGVGATLEYYLGIKPNCSKEPDYKGIELKASRTNNFKQKNRVNLFTQVPDWANSNGMNALKLLNEYGYWSIDKSGQQRFNLYCTVEANNPNPQGLYFDVDYERDLLINRSLVNGQDNYVVQWNLDTLRSRLLSKHKETFWVKATSKFENNIEYFRYDLVIHTKNPNVSLFGPLIGSRVITMDYTMHLKPNGMVRDHGYIFKIRPQNVNLLFPAPITYQL